MVREAGADRHADSPSELRARALRLLGRREHSRSELARKLKPRAASREALDALLEDLAAKNQLSEARFAEVRAEVLARKYGTARIRLDLRARGIPVEQAEAAAAAAGDERTRARAILERRYRTPADSREERARRTRFLAARGFSHDTIRDALSGVPEDDEV
ncbi:MAG: recombination regulator RecX [Proteobacteria bacterium]|nr:recombination regulator RecX [Pseudomonadota bacterium]